MKLADIENMTVAELKTVTEDALVDAIKDEDQLATARRYVKARRDATMRDEKLAEAAGKRAEDEKTIGNLNDSLGDAKDTIANTRKANEQLIETVEDRDATIGKMQSLHDSEINNRETTRVAEVTGLGVQIATLTDQLAAQTARAERFKAEAVRNRSALATMARVANDAVALQTIEDLERTAE